MQQVMNHSKRNRAVARAAALLFDEGYTLIGNVDLGTYVFATLRHKRNKNIVSLKANEESIKYYRNGKLYKEDRIRSCEVCKH